VRPSQEVSMDVWEGPGVQEDVWAQETGAD
jgi:hypothetical protein